MIVWVKGLFGGGTGHGYRARERSIYRFHDGSSWRHADPLRVQQGLAACEELDLEADAKLTGLGVPESREALQRIVAGVRRAFGVEPLSPDGRRGLTDQECVELLLHFCDYLGALKKKAAPWQTSPGPTAPPGGPSPTPSGSAST